MDSEKASAIKKLQSELKDRDSDSLKMLIGIDGFIDEIVHVVDTRQDFENFTRIKTIEDFGNRILKASGLSNNMELVPMQLKLGGNGPIFSNSLIQYGVKLTYVGALGEENIHPVFMPMTEKCSAVYSLCDPGHTHAVEFEDGKLIIGKMASLNKITWNRFKEVVGGVEKIADIIKDCCLIGMENWTMVPRMDDVLKGIIDEVGPLLPQRDKKPLAFFDLADPEKRTKKDIMEAMSLISRFEERFRTILGLNEKELFEIADVFGVEYDRTLPRLEKLKAATTETYNRLDIHCLVVHPTKEAVACTRDGYFEITGPYCAKPVLTTGAGDNFNSGFCLAQSFDLDIESSLLVGVATSGFYVRNGKSPSRDELASFLKQWADGEF